MGDAAARIVAAADEALAPLLARADAAPEADLGAEATYPRVADVLSHLHAWHVLLVGWLAADAAGRTPAYPAEDRTWDQLADLNRDLYLAHRHLSYDEARISLLASHRSAVAAIGRLDDATLTVADRFAWLGGDSLGAVAHECLGAHYAWAEGVLDRAEAAAS